MSLLGYMVLTNKLDGILMTNLQLSTNQYRNENVSTEIAILHKRTQFLQLAHIMPSHQDPHSLQAQKCLVTSNFNQSS